MSGGIPVLNRLVVRPARVPKLDGVATLETSADGGFRKAMQVRWRIEPAQYGHAITRINDLVDEPHHACDARVGRIAA